MRQSKASARIGRVSTTGPLSNRRFCDAEQAVAMAVDMFRRYNAALKTAGLVIE
jgi:hypothetical protein